MQFHRFSLFDNSIRFRRIRFELFLNRKGSFERSSESIPLEERERFDQLCSVFYRTILNISLIPSRAKVRTDEDQDRGCRYR